MKYSRTIWSFASVILILLLVVFLPTSFFPQTPPPPPVANLQGFEDGTSVEYKIQNQAGLDLQGIQETEDGQPIVLSELGIEDLKLDMPLIYDFLINESGADPYNVTLKFDPSKGEAMMEGEGFPSFADIRLENGSNVLETKADWAGIVKSEAFAYGKDQIDTNLKLAFSAPTHIESDVPQDTRIIQILNAPGGGSVGPGGVNQFTGTHCGAPLLSTCRPGLVLVTQQVVQNYVMALQLMTEQLSAVMIDYVMIVGTFFDAKQQLETQRLHQELTAEAHKDYHVSEQMCQFGSFVKSVADTEARASLNREALNGMLLASYSNLEDASSAEGGTTDMRARIELFRKEHCDPSDHNDGLGFMCDHDQNFSGGAVGATDEQRVNKDISYTRTTDFPLTLDVDFTDDTVTDDEKDVIALARNLYWPQVFEPAVARGVAQQFPDYMNARQVMAMNAVAHNSFVHIASMKAEANPSLEDQAGPAFMKALLRDFGLDDNDIEELMGENPSYYAQMEVLTKKIYQNPDYYTHLYDKPANIDRINVSIDAFKLMQARDMYESSLRKEMLMSLMLEEALSKVQSRVDNAMTSEAAKVTY